MASELTPPQLSEPTRAAPRVGRLTITGLTKRYGGVTAASEVTLDVQPGEFFTLLGPSGSGKTTTMMAIAGFVAPDAGSILLDGKRLDSRTVEERNLGVVFQNYALFPHMTVRENLSFPLEVRGMNRAEVARRVGESLELVGLGGREAMYPSQLSGGQQQRIALARALIFEPAVLLMDEPLGALDKNMRSRLQLELRHLQRRLGITTIYVTHDQDEAFTMSDRIAVMNQGRVEQVDSPTEVYESPKSLFVAEFVGDSNVFTGTVERHDGDRTAVAVPALGTLWARRSEARPGANVILTIRPEHFAVGDPQPGWNEITGRVSEAVYAGSTTRYWIDGEGASRCLVRIPNSILSPRFDVGQELVLTFRPEDVVPFELAPAES